MIDVQKARLVLSKALLAQDVNSTTATEALKHLGGPVDLEHEVRYSKPMSQGEIEEAFRKTWRQVK